MGIAIREIANVAMFYRGASDVSPVLYLCYPRQCLSLPDCLWCRARARGSTTAVRYRLCHLTDWSKRRDFVNQKTFLYALWHYEYELCPRFSIRKLPNRFKKLNLFSLNLITSFWSSEVKLVLTSNNLTKSKLNCEWERKNYLSGLKLHFLYLIDHP